MLRWISFAAIAASFWGGPALSQTSFTYGVFRENLPASPVNERNCWSQAMVSGGTINGEVIASGLTEAEAAQQLMQLGNSGLCANQRTATDWAARHDSGGGAGHSGPPGWDRRAGGHRDRHRHQDREGTAADRVDQDGSNRDLR